jgi:hypothetical protein
MGDTPATGISGQHGPGRYEIRMSGRLGERWSDWFSDMSMRYDTEARETVLLGYVPDQAALHGLLARIRDLGLTIVSVQRLPSRREPP